MPEAQTEPSAPSAGAPRRPKISAQQATTLTRLVTIPIASGVRTSPAPRSPIASVAPTETGMPKPSRMRRQRPPSDTTSGATPIQRHDAVARGDREHQQRPEPRREHERGAHRARGLEGAAAADLARDQRDGAGRHGLEQAEA